jgi:hypothetical protein
VVVALHRPVLLELAAVQPVIPVLLEPQALLGPMVVLAVQILVVVLVLAIQHTPGQRATAAPASSSFDTSVHSAAQAARSHLLVDTPSTPLLHLVHIRHNRSKHGTFCKSK